jgi:hypothetical protein
MNGPHIKGEVGKAMCTNHGNFHHFTTGGYMEIIIGNSV